MTPSALRLKRSAARNISAVYQRGELVPEPRDDAVGWGPRPDEPGVGRSVLAFAMRVRERLDNEESAGGFYATLVDMAPRLAPAVARLRRDHDEIRASLSWLCECARAPSPALPVDVAFAQLAEQLHRHRAREDALVQEMLLTDIGDAD